MKKIIFVLITLYILSSCTTKKTFTIAFGSCNNHKNDNNLWGNILQQKPDVWVWGGDNVYCDTEDAITLKKCYNKQKNKPNYQNFSKQMEIIGVWDDHDYGVNDGGKEYPMKEASQKLFLDFMNVPTTSVRRKQKGVYHSVDYSIGRKSVKIILLDTRYFRTALTKDENSKKRYKPNIYNEGSILGKAQWQWLTNTLISSKADYNIIVSSIQFLSNQHGYEAWTNMPHEIDTMENLILKSKAKGVILLSGDRHISEISLKRIGATKQALVDFTSSGLNNAYANFPGEDNPYRVSKVVHQNSYGLVKLNFKNRKVAFEMWGENNQVLEVYSLSIE